MNPMPFKEAVDYFKGKTPLPEPQFRKLASEIGDRAHSLAFSVSGIARRPSLGQCRLTSRFRGGSERP